MTNEILKYYYSIGEYAMQLTTLLMFQIRVEIRFLKLYGAIFKIQMTANDMSFVEYSLKIYFF